MVEEPPNCGTSSNNSGRLAPMFAIFAFLACNGTIILIATLSTIGIAISIDPHLQAAAISLFAVATLLLVFRDFRKHRSIGPLILAGVACAILIGTMYIHFNKVVESVGLLALFVATLWSWQLDRRQHKPAAP